MRRTGWFLILLLLVAGAAHGEEFGLFNGEADVSLGTYNPDAAKSKAVTIALAVAIEQALPRVAPAEELELKKNEIKDRILRKPQRYVVNYSVLTQEVRAATLHLTLEARIQLDTLREAVRAISLAPAATGKRAEIMLAPYAERPDGFAFASEMDESLRERFEMANQPLASAAATEDLLAGPSAQAALRENRLDELARVATVKNIRLLILMQLNDETPVIDRDVRCDQTLKIRVVDAPSEKIVAAFQYRFPIKGSCDKQFDAAGKELFGVLMETLGKQGRLAETGAGVIYIELLKVSDFDRLQEVQALLRNRAYVQKAELESFEPGRRVRFAVVYGGSVEQLAADLAAVKAASFVLKPSGQKGNLLQYQLEPR